MSYETDQINILVHLVLNLVDRVTVLEQKNRYAPPGRLVRMEGAINPCKGVARKILSQEDRTVVITLFQNGKSVDEIGSVTSWSHQTIYNCLKAAGITVKRARTYTAGSERAAAAKERGTK